MTPESQPLSDEAQALIREHGHKFNSKAHFEKHLAAIEAAVRAATTREVVVLRHFIDEWANHSVDCPAREWSGARPDCICGFDEALAAITEQALTEGQSQEAKDPAVRLDGERQLTQSACVYVPTQLVRLEWPPNNGLQPGDKQFDDLLAAIRADGYIREPLHITAEWRVIDGAHRLCIARLLGMGLVPVRIWTGAEWLPSAPTALIEDSSTESSLAPETVA